MLEMVVTPYRRKLKSDRVLPKKALDIFTVYRVVYQLKDSEDLVDVFLPVTQVHGAGPKRRSTDYIVTQLFCVGMEFELERYVRWLDTEALTDRNGQSPDIHIGIQSAGEAIRAVEQLIPSSGTDAVICVHKTDKDIFRHTPLLSIPSSYSVRRKEWLLF